MSAHALSKILMRGLSKGFNSVKNVLKIEDEQPNFGEGERCDTHPHLEHIFVLFNLFTAVLHRRCSSTSSHHSLRSIPTFCLEAHWPIPIASLPSQYI